MSKKLVHDHLLTMQGTVTVGAKGQIVIPKKVRDRLHITDGDELVVFMKGETAIGLVKSSDISLLRTYLDNELQSKN